MNLDRMEAIGIEKPDDKEEDNHFWMDLKNKWL